MPAPCTPFSRWSVAPLLLLTAVLAGCKVDSVNPISSFESARPDTAIYGVWRYKDKDELSYLHIGPEFSLTDAASPGNRRTRIVVVDHKRNGLTDEAYVAYTSRVGKQRYLNVVQADGARTVGYLFVQYTLVARNTLGRSNAALEQSLTRLSTGLRINTGKDDPAGLIASENLRSDITSIRKAISNTDRANQVIATADSALGQVSSLLNDIRGLVTESANSGALSQAQLDGLKAGVEIDVAETAVAQKRIIGSCHRFVKAVIVATQMLDSMHRSPRPTRAEVNDIANSILDGADACMLSGETAIGDYPREAVQMMNRIMLATERMLNERPPLDPPPAASSGVHPITAAVVAGATTIAEQLQAKMLVVATRTGGTARVLAKHHSLIPMVGVSDHDATLRHIPLFCGIVPVAGAPMNHGPQLRAYVADWGVRDGSLATGDRVVYITGSEVVPTAHNLVVVHEVE